MKFLILKTKSVLTEKQHKSVLNNIVHSANNGVVLLDGNFEYEIAEVDVSETTVEKLEADGQVISSKILGPWSET
ncbi:hypothetical protein [Evansella clarkii]|uniref:hypothetical protein n=1 Tax=Evansella clarkii TaxID=79879 RepID=UPI0009980ED1|nr:hypothetical protein [Evansella clarkii]